MKLFKRGSNKVFTGVIGGLCKKFDIPPFLGRVVFIAATVSTCFVLGLVVYTILYAISEEDKK